MRQVYERLRAALAAGECGVVCTILEADGSTPRGAGAKMAVLAGGETAGTVGGGALEYVCIGQAREVLAQGRSRTARFSLDTGGALGMVCGGDVTVYLQRFTPAALPLVETILALLAARADSWLVTALSEDGTWTAGTAADGVLRGLPEDLWPAVRPLLRRQPALAADAALYVEPLGRAGRVYVFGGGHVAQALVPALAQVDFAVTVCENRAEFARPALFPAAEAVALLEFDELAERFAPGPADCIVIMTRGHQDDYRVLTRALETGAGYIGVIGSRRKAAATFDRLRADGFPQAALDRVHTPIGLPIGAETPAEIAVSVTAELIRHRAIRTGGRGKL